MNFRQITLLSLLSLLLISCGTSKQTVTVEDVNKDTYSETQLTEEQQNEFEYTFIEGLKQKQAGNDEQAKQLFARCLEIDPLSAVSLYELGKLHYANKDLTSAALLLERAESINPTNKWYKITLAQIYQQAGNFSEAATLYDELYQMDKENVNYLYAEAVFWGQAKEYTKAIDTYNELEEIKGLNAQLTMAKQKLYVESGEFDKAVDEIQALIDSAPEDPRYYGLMAELYQNEGDYDKALTYYTKVKEVDPNNGFIYISLANFYEEQENYEKSYENLEAAFNSDKLDVDTKIQYYLILGSQPDSTYYTDEQVSNLIDILHNKYPDDNRMYAIYADHLIKQDKQEEAREYIAKFIEKNPEAYEMWWQSLMISNNLQDWDRLITDSEEALKYFPEEATVYMMKAVGQLQLEQYQASIETAKQGLEHTNDNVLVQSQLEVFIADANYQLGRVDEAIEAYEKVVEIDPTNYPALNNLAYYLSQQNRDLEKAETYANKVIQANPNNAVYLDTYAWVLFKQGDYSLAKFYQETALDNDESNDGVYVEHYGDILFKLGEEDKALEQWKKAKELGVESKVLDEKIKTKTYIAE